MWTKLTIQFARLAIDDYAGVLGRVRVSAAIRFFQARRQVEVPVISAILQDRAITHITQPGVRGYGSASQHTAG